MTGQPNVDAVRERHYPEIRFGGFSRESAGMEFYTRINALLEPHFRVLDLGAGRGAYIDTDQSPFARRLKIFRGKVAQVSGCDVDPAIEDNPYLDDATVTALDNRLPYPDESFDLIHASWVLEHVDGPQSFVAEVLRVLKPGGYFCANTPNRHGYIAIASRLAGNSRHNRLLRKIQPERKEFDVFPTRYRMNTKGALKRLFAGSGDLVVYASSSDPSYYFGRGWLLGAFRVLHKFTPASFHTTLLVFFRKG